MKDNHGWVQPLMFVWIFYYAFGIQYSIFDVLLCTVYAKKDNILIKISRRLWLLLHEPNDFFLFILLSISYILPSIHLNSYYLFGIERYDFCTRRFLYCLYVHSFIIIIFESLLADTNLNKNCVWCAQGAH